MGARGDDVECQTLLCGNAICPGLKHSFPRPEGAGQCAGAATRLPVRCAVTREWYVEAGDLQALAALTCMPVGIPALPDPGW